MGIADSRLLAFRDVPYRSRFIYVTCCAGLKAASVTMNIRADIAFLA